MKQTGKCPKCGGTDITEVPASVHYDDGPSIRAGAFASYLSNVMITRYVCCDCGYVEQWLDPDEFKRRAKTYWDKKARADQELDELDEYWRQQLKEKKEQEAREAEQKTKNKGKLPWEF